MQSRDNAVVDDMTLKVVTKRAPTEAELRDLKFAFRVAKHVKSNTIVYAKDLATVGIGAGQMSRVDSARIAARKAQDAAVELKLAEPLTKGSVVASDAFFPFADGMLACIEAGATAVIQPGGSVRDDEVIKAADDARHRHGVHRRQAFPALGRPAAAPRQNSSSPRKKRSGHRLRFSPSRMMTIECDRSFVGVRRKRQALMPGGCAPGAGSILRTQFLVAQVFEITANLRSFIQSMKGCSQDR